ncbi:hypothetical protein ALC60_11629, partial [Trachymyrmex zeteki]
KLGDQYTGPYEIIEVLKNNNVKIRISNLRTRIVHTDKLKLLPAYEEERGVAPNRPSEDIADFTEDEQ